ncbi:MAG: sporulation transcription factor Spo0A [Bacilli bacterium]|nr:sporulation transcription factor Spo0A [Bacilli bacterium]
MKSIKVIVIDDNKDIVNMIKNYFKEHKDIEVVFEATTGEDGIRLITKHLNEFDLIILDLIMPNKDGIDVLTYLNKNQIDKKVIILTSYNEQTMIRKVAELGASYMILKPFELSELRKKIIEITSNSNERILINLHNNNIQIVINRTLHELGIPSHIKGYQYIKEGIVLVYMNPELIRRITKELYPEIANKYEASVASVEKAIRHAIDISWNRGDWELMEELFGHSIDIDKAKPTNSEFIITIADKIRLEYTKPLTKH